MPENEQIETPKEIGIKLDCQDAAAISRRLAAVLETAAQYGQSVEVKVTIAISDRL